MRYLTLEVLDKEIKIFTVSSKESCKEYRRYRIIKNDYNL
ncbi:hypothetical protein ACSXE2_15900 (plasmid) [Clostridium perfringens]